MLIYLKPILPIWDKGIPKPHLYPVPRAGPHLVYFIPSIYHSVHVGPGILKHTHTHTQCHGIPMEIAI